MYIFAKQTKISITVLSEIFGPCPTWYHWMVRSCDYHCSIRTRGWLRYHIFFGGPNYVRFEFEYERMCLSNSTIVYKWIFCHTGFSFSSFNAKCSNSKAQTFYFSCVNCQTFTKSAISSQKPWHSWSHKHEVSLRHTSQHKQFGTCDVMSIPPHTRRMLLLLCHFNISQRTSEISLPCTRMSTNDRTVGKEQQICYRWQRAMMDLRGVEHPQHNWLQTVDAQRVAASMNSCQKIKKEIKRTKLNVLTEYIVIRSNLVRGTLFIIFLLLIKRVIPSSNWWHKTTFLWHSKSALIIASAICLI